MEKFEKVTMNTKRKSTSQDAFTEKTQKREYILFLFCMLSMLTFFHLFCRMQDVTIFCIFLVFFLLSLFLGIHITKERKKYQVSWSRRGYLSIAISFFIMILFGIYFLPPASAFVVGQTGNEIQNDLLPDYDIHWNEKDYLNSFEEAVLSRSADDVYKMIPISGVIEGTDVKYQGYLVAVYDASRVKLAVSSGIGEDASSFGEMIPTMVARENALLAINAGGFYDPDWRSNGGIPHGPVISNGRLLTNYEPYPAGGGIIGFNLENKLILKPMSGEEAIKEGIRDAVDWGPYLIVDGKNLTKAQNELWAVARTAIGQRKDGIVLMLVIDGLQEHSRGATFYEMAKIMEQYGAYNAANLDGGTSTSLYVGDQFINNPFNGEQRTIRRLPNAWIVTGK